MSVRAWIEIALGSVLVRSAARNIVALLIGICGSGIVNSVTNGTTVDWVKIFSIFPSYAALVLIMLFGIFEAWLLKRDVKYLAEVRAATKDEARIEALMEKLAPKLEAEIEKDIASGNVKTIDDLRKRISGNG